MRSRIELFGKQIPLRVTLRYLSLRGFNLFRLFAIMLLCTVAAVIHIIVNLLSRRALFSTLGAVFDYLRSLDLKPPLIDLRFLSPLAFDPESTSTSMSFPHCLRCCFSLSSIWYLRVLQCLLYRDINLVSVRWS